MTNIIAFAGHKVAGKNTAVNFIVGVHLSSLGIVQNEWGINTDGELFINDLFGDVEGAGVFDINRQNPDMDAFRKAYLDQYVKVYSFADLLKRSICIEILGLTEEQCFGTNEQKDSLTHLKWEDMPVPSKDIKKALHAPGFMTAREVMQYVGTNIFRTMFNNVWVDALMRKINADNADLALISDCRFPNEADGVAAAGGKVVYLTRNPYGNQDQHESETALDNYDSFAAILDNKDMTIAQQNKAVYEMLHGWGVIPGIDEIENKEEQ
jgi:hypothetical protein